MENIEIRIAMTRHGIKQWQLAKLLGISESVMSRMLRSELPREKQDEIVSKINLGAGDPSQEKQGAL